jgi:DNA-binding NtrC family response regulator
MGNKILLVDDDAELCEEMKEILQSEGYSVETSSDGKRAESLIKNNIYDVVILDFKMPGLNGVDILKEVKETRPTTKVFIITGKPFIEKYLEEEKLTDFVAGYMNKPFEVEKLIEKIKSNG